jgi:hypothetical protein
MDEYTMRSRARLLVLQLEETIKRSHQDIENGTYASALTAGRIAKTQLIDLCILLEMLADREP